MGRLPFYELAGVVLLELFFRRHESGICHGQCSPIGLSECAILSASPVQSVLLFSVWSIR